MASKAHDDLISDIANLRTVCQTMTNALKIIADARALLATISTSWTLYNTVSMELSLVQAQSLMSVMLDTCHTDTIAKLNSLQNTP